MSAEGSGLEDEWALFERQITGNDIVQGTGLGESENNSAVGLQSTFGDGHDEPLLPAPSSPDVPVYLSPKSPKVDPSANGGSPEFVAYPTFQTKPYASAATRKGPTLLGDIAAYDSNDEEGAKNGSDDDANSSSDEELLEKIRKVQGEIDKCEEEAQSRPNQISQSLPTKEVQRRRPSGSDSRSSSDEDEKERIVAGSRSKSPKSAGGSSGDGRRIGSRSAPKPDDRKESKSHGRHHRSSGTSEDSRPGGKEVRQKRPDQVDADRKKSKSRSPRREKDKRRRSHSSASRSRSPEPTKRSKKSPEADKRKQKADGHKHKRKRSRSRNRSSETSPSSHEQKRQRERDDARGGSSDKRSNDDGAKKRRDSNKEVGSSRRNDRSDDRGDRRGYHRVERLDDRDRPRYDDYRPGEKYRGGRDRNRPGPSGSRDDSSKQKDRPRKVTREMMIDAILKDKGLDKLKDLDDAEMVEVNEKHSDLPLDDPLAHLKGNKRRIAELSKKAQEFTGVALPKYYNPAAINPLKYAEQVQKRKLLWAGAKEKKEVSSSWQTLLAATSGDADSSQKFRKLVGYKDEACKSEQESAEEIRRKQQELMKTLDQQYEVARLSTHQMRGFGLGFGLGVSPAAAPAAESSANPPPTTS